MQQAFLIHILMRSSLEFRRQCIVKRIYMKNIHLLRGIDLPEISNMCVCV